MTAVVFFILPFQRVAGGAESQREDLIDPAGATHRLLD